MFEELVKKMKDGLKAMIQEHHRKGLSELEYQSDEILRRGRLVPNIELLSEEFDQSWLHLGMLHAIKGHKKARESVIEANRSWSEALLTMQIESDLLSRLLDAKSLASSMNNTLSSNTGFEAEVKRYSEPLELMMFNESFEDLSAEDKVHTEGLNLYKTVTQSIPQFELTASGNRQDIGPREEDPGHMFGAIDVSAVSSNLSQAICLDNGIIGVFHCDIFSKYALINLSREFLAKHNDPSDPFSPRSRISMKARKGKGKFLEDFKQKVSKSEDFTIWSNKRGVNTLQKAEKPVKLIRLSGTAFVQVNLDTTEKLADFTFVLYRFKNNKLEFKSLLRISDKRLDHTGLISTAVSQDGELTAVLINHKELVFIANQKPETVIVDIIDNSQQLTEITGISFGEPGPRLKTNEGSVYSLLVLLADGRLYSYSLAFDQQQGKLSILCPPTQLTSQISHIFDQEKILGDQLRYKFVSYEPQHGTVTVCALLPERYNTVILFFTFCLHSSQFKTVMFSNRSIDSDEEILHLSTVHRASKTSRLVILTKSTRILLTLSFSINPTDHRLEITRSHIPVVLMPKKNLDVSQLELFDDNILISFLEYNFLLKYCLTSKQIKIF